MIKGGEMGRARSAHWKEEVCTEDNVIKSEGKKGPGEIVM
jgi:hypothetical protein